MAKVQLNLLPDSKVAFNKASALMNKVRFYALIASCASLAIFFILVMTVYGVQKGQLSSTNKDITTLSNKLKSTPNIDKVVTVQNQLKSLVALHQSKHITSRIFTFLPQLTPANVTINKLTLDIKQNTLNISGTSDTQQSVNTFVDTLKTATYRVNSSDAATPAFSSVVESGFNISSTNINYTINLQFDPKLFANNLLDSAGRPQTPKLIVSKAASPSTKAPSTTLFNSSQTGR